MLASNSSDLTFKMGLSSENKYICLLYFLQETRHLLLLSILELLNYGLLLWRESEMELLSGLNYT